MDIVVSQEEGRVPVTVMHVDGSIDIDSYAQFQSQCRQCIETGMRYLLLDLAGVPYISSVGLRALFDVLKLMGDDPLAMQNKTLLQESSGGPFRSLRVKLFKPSERVLRTLTMAGFDIFLEIHNDNLEEAVASFEQV